MPTLTPYFFVKASLRRSRNCITALISTSLKVVSIAAVCCASTRRRAIVARRLLMRSRVSLRSLAAWGLGLGAWALELGAWGLALGTWGCKDGASAFDAAGPVAFKTSCFVTRGPLVATDAMLTSCALATFFAVGVAFLSVAG